MNNGPQAGGTTSNEDAGWGGEASAAASKPNESDKNNDDASASAASGLISNDFQVQVSGLGGHAGPANISGQIGGSAGRHQQPALQRKDL